MRGVVEPHAQVLPPVKQSHAEGTPQIQSEQTQSLKAAVPAAEADYRQKQQQAAEEAKTIELPEGSTWHKHGGAELEPLLFFTTLVCVRWLLKFAKGDVLPTWHEGRKGVVPAWQQVPPEATVSLDQLRQTTMQGMLPVAVLSYGWTGRGHPDSTGAHLRSLVPALRAMVRTCDDGLGPSGGGEHFAHQRPRAARCTRAPASLPPNVE